MSLIWTNRVTNQPLDKIEDTLLLNVLDEWVRADRAVPDDPPSQMPVAALTAALPYMALVDLNEDSSEPTYRIFGDALERLLGIDAEGRSLRDVYHPKIFAEIKGTFTATKLLKRPIYTVNEFNILWKKFGYRRLVLPLTSKAGEIDRMIIVLRPLSPAIRAAADWRDHLLEAEKTDDQLAKEARWITRLKLAD